MTQSYLTLSDLESQSQGHSDFENFENFEKGAELGTMLLLNTNTKAYMGSPLIQLHFDFSDLKGLCQGHSHFESLYLIK